MPLVLSLKEGDDFFVDGTQFVVVDVEGPSRFRLRDEDSQKAHQISDAESAEILPDVFVSAGDRPQFGVVRAAIDAPREILILRGDRLRDTRKRVSA